MSPFRQHPRSRVIKQDIFEGPSLATKIILAYSILFGIAIIFVILFVNTRAEEDLHRNALERNYQDLQFAQNEIDEKISLFFRLTFFFQLDNRLRFFLLSPYTYTDLEIVELNNQTLSNFERFISIIPEISSVEILHTIEQLPTGLTLLTRVPKEDFALKALSLQPYQPFWDFNQLTQHVYFFYPLFAAEDVIAIVKVGMTFQEFFGQFYRYPYEGGVGLAINFPDYSLIMDSPITFFGNPDSPRELFTVLSQTENEKGLVRSIGARSFGFTRSHSQLLGVDFVMLTSLDVLSESLKVMQRTNLGIITLVGILLLLVVTGITNHFLGQLHQLTVLVQKTNLHDENYLLPVKSNDEIGFLSSQINGMLKRIHDLMIFQVNQANAHRRAELRALQGQINSHFLFNTLESIKMLSVIEKNFRVAESITALGKLFRYTMKWGSDFILLKYEVEYLKSYVTIMNIRHNGIIRLDTENLHHYEQFEIPKMILQPLIENAIIHGLKSDGSNEQTIGSLDIELDFIELECGFEIHCKNNGFPIKLDAFNEINKKLNETAENLNKTQYLLEQGNLAKGIGLVNIHERLMITYGRDSGIRVAQQDGAAFVVILRCVREN